MKQIKKTITKAEIAAMPKVLFPGRIFVIYTESEAEKAVAYLKDQRIVGVDTETRPSFKRGTTHKVALLQISTQDTCFLFRLNRIGMPDSLQEFLMSDTLKIGLSLKDDFNSLRKRENVHPDRGNWIELIRRFRKASVFPIGRRMCLARDKNYMQPQMRGLVWKFTIA